MAIRLIPNPKLSADNTCLITASSLFFLAFILSCIGYTGFAQVTVTPANDTLVCSRTALTGAAPSCTTLPTSITITEALSADFNLTGPGPGFNQIVLNPPAGWQFCTSTLPTVTPVGGDVALGAVSVSFVAGNLQIQFHAATLFQIL